MAQEYSELITKDKNKGTGIIFCGGLGTGKTHLACAIGNDYLKSGTVLFTKVSRLIRHIRESYSSQSTKTEQQILNEYRDIDLLIIDEIGVQRGTKEEENLLFEVIDDRYSYFKSTILISNLNLCDIEKYLGERAIDRMKENGGMAVLMAWESYRSQVELNKALPDLNWARYK
jgi:DNA replication protein DnaC